MPNKPALPARKAAGRRTAAANTKHLPIIEAQHVTLEDGTEVPIKIPPGMPAAQAQALVAYLKANPAAAKAAYEQAQQMMKNPAMANAFSNMLAPQQNEAMTQRLAVLKDDPELQHIWEDVQKNGPNALQKYWDDTEVMIKISQKLRAMQQAEAGAAPGAEGAAAQPAEGAEAPAPKPPASNLHDAAKQGDVEAAKRLIEEGADVNQANERGISPLGVAVGFNRVEVVELLLAKGGDVAFRDPKGNTLMHYAAGYGRQAIAKVLLDAGADGEAENQQKQRPIDVAKVNGEKEMAKWLQLRLKSAKKAAAARAKAGGAAPAAAADEQQAEGGKEEAAAAPSEAAAK